jgi:hypothetical protein
MGVGRRQREPIHRTGGRRTISAPTVLGSPTIAMSTAPHRHRSGHGVPVAGLGQPVQFCVQVSPPAAPALRSRRGSSRSTRCGGGPAAQPGRSCARHRPLRARISDNARHSCGDRLSCYQQVSYLSFTNSPARAIVIPARCRRLPLMALRVALSARRRLRGKRYMRCSLG